MTKALSFAYVDNSRSHDDLILRVGGSEWTCDSYYLALDDELMPERKDATKVRVVLKHLLQQWLATVERLANGEVAFLPYDFSDEYTGWLRCERHGDAVSVSQGWSSGEGWFFTPSSIPPGLLVVPEFKSHGLILEISRQELQVAIRASIQQVA